NQLTKLGGDLTARAGLTPQQWLVLLQVAGDPNFPQPAGPPAPPAHASRGVLASDIALARGVSRANVSALLAGLLRRGFVRQEEQSRDRRRKHLVLTPAGRKVLHRLETSRRRANRDLLADLDTRQCVALNGALLACLRRLWLPDMDPSKVVKAGGPSTRESRG
ncbi:MAG: MarR family transcriptional regulator, partial [Acidobacteriota bacterium]